MSAHNESLFPEGWERPDPPESLDHEFFDAMAIVSVGAVAFFALGYMAGAAIGTSRLVSILDSVGLW